MRKHLDRVCSVPPSLLFSLPLLNLFFFFLFFLVYPFEQTTRKWIMIDGCGYLRRRKENINSSFFIMDVHTSFDSWKIQFNSRHVQANFDLRWVWRYLLAPVYCFCRWFEWIYEGVVRACDLPFGGGKWNLKDRSTIYFYLLLIFFFFFHANLLGGLILG